MSILSRLVLFYCFLNPLLAESQMFNRDTLYHYTIDKFTSDEDRLLFINTLSKFYYSSPKDSGDIIEKVTYFDKKGIPSDSLEAVCLSDIYFNIGFIILNNNDWNGQSLFCFIKAKKLISKYHLPERQAKLSKELGLRYFYYGLYKESIDEYLTSIEIHKSLNDTNALFDLYSDIAKVYKLVGNEKELQKYWEIIGNSEVSEKTYKAKAELYQQKIWQYNENKKFKSAIKYQQELIELSNAFNTNYQKKHHVNELISFYIADGKNKEALMFLDSLSEYEFKVYSFDPYHYNNYGKAYMYLKQYDDAIYAFEKSIDFIEFGNENSIWIVCEGYEYLSKIYKKEQDESMYLECLEKMKIANDAETLQQQKKKLKELKVQLAYYRLNSSTSEKIEDIIFQIDSLEKKMSGK